MRLYHSPSSPNSRRVRILIAEKGLSVPLVPIDLGKGEQHSEAYRAINPRRVVPTLVLDDGTAIGEVPVISRYLDDVHPQVPMFGDTPQAKARAAMWERLIEQEGFAPVMEAVRNKAAGLRGRAVAGPHDIDQIPGLVERGLRRLANLQRDMEARLRDHEYVAGDGFSVADITLLVTLDFASSALEMPLPEGSVTLRRWSDQVSRRPSAAA